MTPTPTSTRPALALALALARQTVGVSIATWRRGGGVSCHVPTVRASSSVILVQGASAFHHGVPWGRTRVGAAAGVTAVSRDARTSPSGAAGCSGSAGGGRCYSRSRRGGGSTYDPEDLLAPLREKVEREMAGMTEKTPSVAALEKEGGLGVEDDEDGDAGSGAGKNETTGEWNGPRGPEPTRYGDWERGGRCSDF